MICMGAALARLKVLSLYAVNDECDLNSQVRIQLYVYVTYDNKRHL